MHFTGHPDKELGIARFADRFDIGQEIVPEPLLDKYHVRVRSPLRGARRAWRERSVDTLAAVKFRLRPHKDRIRHVAGFLPPAVRRRWPLGHV